MTQRFDVVIVGGGIVGLSAAIAMQQRGYSVAILDAVSLTQVATNHRVYALNQASQQLLTRLGVWQNIQQQHISPYRHMHVWDGTNQAHIDFNSRMIGLDKLGVIMEECVLKQALLEKALTLDIVLLSNFGVERLAFQDRTVTLGANEREISGDLLIAADGAQSSTRQLLQVPLTTWSYHQQAIVASVTVEQSHQETAYQIFLQEGALAFLPLVNSHQCSIVWSTSIAHAKDLMALSEEEFGQQLTHHFAEKLGDCRLLTSRSTFPLHMRQASTYSGKNWLLMGDAAHTIHPLAGLGLNMGLADLSTWIALLDEGKQKAWSSRALTRYQRQRKHAVWQTIGLMEGLKTLFLSSFPAVKMLRGIGLNVCNHSMWLKRFFINQASG